MVAVRDALDDLPVFITLRIVLNDADKVAACGALDAAFLFRILVDALIVQDTEHVVPVYPVELEADGDKRILDVEHLIADDL